MKYELTYGERFHDLVLGWTYMNGGSILFTDEVAPKGAMVPGYSNHVIDLSKDRDGSVVGWFEGDTYKISTQAKGQKVIFNEDCGYMFCNRGLKKIINLNMVDTPNVKNMKGMFWNCAELSELDLSSFNTSNVKDMSEMFYECERLTNLDLSSFDTSNVEDMSRMFLDCAKLKQLDLSSFDTSQVKYMHGMFSINPNLEK